MKTILLLGFIFTLSVQCYSQIDPQKLLYLQKAEKARRMKNTGRALTMVGGVLFITGIVTSVNNIKDYNNTGIPLSSSELRNNFLLYAGGTAGLSSGIPIWVLGGTNQRKYDDRAMSISFKINTSPQNKGLTLTYRF
ncbi:MAG TPA: hypothetical protein PLS08_07575 [Chryseolinea sp.]|nr:hypothetical protein [Chryseolinea sp.]